jgi:hypothetical protein
MSMLNSEQHLHPDNEIYYPFIKSTSNVISAATKSGTVQRIVFTQAGAGLVDSEVGDTYGTRMEQKLNGMIIRFCSILWLI